MKKRYWIFKYPIYCPSGGMKDFYKEFDTQEEAILYIEELDDQENCLEQFHIYDTTEHKIICETRIDKDGIADWKHYL